MTLGLTFSERNIINTDSFHIRIIFNVNMRKEPVNGIVFNLNAKALADHCSRNIAAENGNSQYSDVQGIRPVLEHF